MQKDPNGPLFVVRTFEPGKFRPTQRKTFQRSPFKITRTYSFTAEKNLRNETATIRNNVFSDFKAQDTRAPWTISETHADEPEQRRRGYYDKPRSWESVGPQAGDINDELARLPKSPLSRLSVQPCHGQKGPSKTSSLLKPVL